ncbi:ferrous iron transport protein B [Sporomusa acidovorans]|uniref:Ferrous iron transport protein B n=1 Tax=Sporomusa acidovorans (strain ATCC 49682 / DSM 3132 / Mol) TaxID=1123286 RepID=A0ABZ3J1Y5_SPOA4|nr:ferrous iron transport protein B [Sporomusa acidovorans]OZC24328.1 ferrous iron transport protein B [Sporomusa acidovorans DSM 3132]SDF76553.1 ferrous iron transport protein B [Sporomusa acidovorans]
MATTSMTVALAGNPNSGKTTIFNNITGARQHVGNYPGVTVEKREGFCRYQGKDLLFVDLPGTYSLTANALDELVARNVIINDRPDIIINILDASNLERNLYLAVQLLELERPVVLALNMADMAEKMGQKINDDALTRKLGVPVVRTVGNRNQGTDELLETVTKVANTDKPQPFAMNYGTEIETKINEIIAGITSLTVVKYPLRWLAIKLLENDQDVVSAIRTIAGGEKILSLAEKARTDLEAVYHDDIALIIAEYRYRFVGEICKEAIASHTNGMQTISDKIDNVLTHRIMGLPIFFGIMWLLFNFVFAVGQYPQGWLEDAITWVGDFVGQYMVEGDLKSLLIDGVIGGVGSVISFLPQILLLFFGIALLEDTGYMARAAFVMDRVMRAVGLHGKSFIPLLLGFGCNVPAIMGTRTLDNPRDRMVTILVSPLMSCSARLPVYTILIAAFFPEELAGSVLFSIYFIGILLAVVMALLFRKFLFPGTTEAFVMEMPQYHIPTLRSILTHMWERSVLYLKKAGTLILAAAILVWFLVNYPSEVQYSKDFDGLQATVEESFTNQVTEKVLLPLQLEKLEDNASLQALVGQIDEIKSQEEEGADAQAANGLTESEDETADNPQLLELKQANPVLYPYALSYWNMDNARKEAVEKLDEEKASEKLSLSYAGQFGHFVEPVIQPLGFDWKMGVGLVSAVAAKEVLVSTLGTIYSVGDVEDDSTGLQQALANDGAFSPLVAYSLMIFTLIYSPCLAALAVVRRETNSWKWPLFSSVYSTVLAWVLALAVYQIGKFLGY